MRYPLYFRHNATFVSVKSGNWNDYDTWKIRGVDGVLYTTPYVPDRGNPVETGGYTIVLTANAACLSIDNISDVLPDSYQLIVGGVPQFLTSLNQISGCTFLADLQDAGTFVESGGVVEMIINKDSIGVSFPTLVTNGTFASGTTGWTALGGASLTSSGSGGIRITNAATNGSANQIISGLTIGKRYRVKASLVNMGTVSTCTFTVRTSPGNVTLVTQVATVATDFYLTFIASATSIEVRLINGVTTSSVYSEWDNVELYETDSCIQPDTAKRPTKATGSDGINYLLFDGSNDFMYGITAIAATGYTKLITFEWDDTASIGASNHLISSSTNNIHALSITKTNSTTCRIGSALTNALQKDILLSTISTRRITLILTYDDSTDTETLYLNGSQVASAVKTQTIATDLSFILGSFNVVNGSGGASTFLKGKVIELATWNVLLTPTQVVQADRLEEQKFRIPQGNYITVAGAGESVSIGINSPASDPMTNTTDGLNYWPSLNLFRIANDINGDYYSAAATGSQVPYLCSSVFAGLARPVLYVQTGKSGSTISSTSDIGSGNWSSGGTYRSNSIAWIKSMLRASGRTQLDWLQFNLGENDAIYMNAHTGTWTKALFKAALQDYVDEMKAQFPGVKIIIVKSMKQRNVSDVEIYAAQTLAINEAQQEVCNENDDMFFDPTPETFTITNGYTRPDGQHYEKIANQAVGNAHGAIIVANT